MTIRGTLIPIGGNEDKGQEENEGYSVDYIEEGILSHVVREGGGTEARIVVIPTASSIPVVVADNYVEAFDTLGCKNIEVLDIRTRKESDENKNLSILEQADVVMFSGGDQNKIVKFIGKTKAHELLRNRYINEEFVIAGTSAGAMCMSQEMVAGSSSHESLYKGAVKMRPGMGFIKNLVIDTHFIKRGRFGRLAEAMAIHPGLLGLGLAEDTGIIIKGGNNFRVIGSGMVLLFDPSALTHNHHEMLPHGTPISMSNLIVHILANSDGFTLDNRKIDITALEEGFI